MQVLSLAELKDLVKRRILYYISKKGKVGASNLIGNTGVNDPMRGSAYIGAGGDPDRYVLSSDGKIYTKVADEGYSRTKTTVFEPTTDEPTQFITNDDTAVLPGTDAGLSFKILSLFQNSGGAINFYLLNDQNGVVHTNAVNSGTTTAYAERTQIWGPSTRVRWSAAAGVTNFINVEYYKDRQVSDI